MLNDSEKNEIKSWMRKLARITNELNELAFKIADFDGVLEKSAPSEFISGCSGPHDVSTSRVDCNEAAISKILHGVSGQQVSGEQFSKVYTGTEKWTPGISAVKSIRDATAEANDVVKREEEAEFMRAVTGPTLEDVQKLSRGRKQELLMRVGKMMSEPKPITKYTGSDVRRMDLRQKLEYWHGMVTQYDEAIKKARTADEERQLKIERGVYVGHIKRNSKEEGGSWKSKVK